MREEGGERKVSKRRGRREKEIVEGEMVKTKEIKRRRRRETQGREKKRDREERRGREGERKVSKRRGRIERIKGEREIEGEGERVEKVE